MQLEREGIFMEDTAWYSGTALWHCVIIQCVRSSEELQNSVDLGLSNNSLTVKGCDRPYGNQNETVYIGVHRLCC